MKMAEVEQEMSTKACNAYRKMTKDYEMFVSMFYPKGLDESPEDIDLMSDFCAELESVFSESEEVMRRLQAASVVKSEDPETYETLQADTKRIREVILEQFRKVCMSKFASLSPMEQKTISGMSVYMQAGME